MNLSPKIVAVIAAVATLPVASAAATAIPALADQAIAWVVTTIVTAAVSALAGVVAKLTGAKLDAEARDALSRAMTNAANMAIRWMIAEAAAAPWGKRIEVAVDKMLDYVPKGAPGAIDRFGLDATAEKREHLRKMAEGQLIAQLQKMPTPLLEGRG